MAMQRPIIGTLVLYYWGEFIDDEPGEDWREVKTLESDPWWLPDRADICPPPWRVMYTPETWIAQLPEYLQSQAKIQAYLDSIRSIAEGT
jgi:hypothetical protein